MKIHVDILSTPLTDAVFFSKRFGQGMRTTDLGTGPWRRVLRDSDSSEILVWIEKAEQVVNDGEPDEPEKVASRPKQRSKCPLIAAQPVGVGRVITVVVPEMASADTNAVGRGLLDELVLWTLKHYVDKRNQGEKLP